MVVVRNKDLEEMDIDPAQLNIGLVIDAELEGMAFLYRVSKKFKDSVLFQRLSHFAAQEIRVMKTPPPSGRWETVSQAPNAVFHHFGAEDAKAACGVDRSDDAYVQSEHDVVAGWKCHACRRRIGASA